MGTFISFTVTAAVSPHLKKKKKKKMENKRVVPFQNISYYSKLFGVNLSTFSFFHRIITISTKTTPTERRYIYIEFEPTPEVVIPPARSDIVEFRARIPIVSMKGPDTLWK